MFCKYKFNFETLLYNSAQFNMLYHVCDEPVQSHVRHDQPTFTTGYSLPTEKKQFFVNRKSFHKLSNKQRFWLEYRNRKLRKQRNVIHRQSMLLSDTFDNN